LKTSGVIPQSLKVSIGIGFAKQMQSITKMISNDLASLCIGPYTTTRTTPTNEPKMTEIPKDMPEIKLMLV